MLPITLEVRILPWRARRRPNLVDAESRDAPAEVRSIDSISVSQHEARSTLPGKGIDDLLRGPLCRRVVCDIEVSDPSPIVTEYDEDEENSKRGGWQCEQIDGDQVLNVVVEKAPPRLRRWFSMPNHVHGHRGLGNGDAELVSSPCTRGAPHSGLARHMSRISSRTSKATPGRPGRRFRLFQVQ